MTVNTDNSAQQHLHERLQHHLKANGSDTLLGCLGVFHCRKVQQLRRVPILDPCMVTVVSGRKRYKQHGAEYLCPSGSVLLLPSHTELDIGNEPDETSGEYLALCLGFDEPTLAKMPAQSALNNATGSPENWFRPAPETLFTLLDQWIALCQRHAPGPEPIASRRLEIAHTLFADGVPAYMQCSPQHPWSTRVKQILLSDLAHAWRMAEVSKRLACSEATLRRRLQDEDSGFAELLEKLRLSAALGLLQETNWTIQRVAAEVGYDSQSRFTERFKLRFGMTPSELRATRMSVSGESVSAIA